MTTQAPKPSTERRAITVRASEYNAETRELPVAFASETPVLRWYGMEVLSCDPAHVDLSRLRESGRLLLDHSNEVDDIAGAIVPESLKVGADKMCRAVCKLSARQKIDDIAKDIVAGIIPGVSCGYETTTILKDEKAADGTRTITWAWRPHEISLVGVEADPAVGVGRSASGSQNKETAMDKPEITPAADKKPADPQIEIRHAVDQSRKDTAEILKLARQHKADELAETALENGWSLEQFRGELLANIGKRSPAKPADANIGMNEGEKQKYSFMRAIRALSGERGVDAGFEIECSEAAAKRLGQKARGLIVPWDVLTHTRDLTIAGTGSNAVQTTVLGAAFIDLLRNKLVTEQLGATMLTGLVGDLAIPALTTGVTSYWVAENVAPTEGLPVMGQKTASPNTVGAYVDISRKLLKQASVDVENLVRNDIAKSIAQAIDVAALNGAGGAEPAGLLGTSGVNDISVTTGTPTHAELLNFIGEVDTANALNDSCKWAMTGEVWAKLAATAVTGTGNGLVLDPMSKMCLGYPYLTSANVPANTLIFGDWAHLVLCMWGGLDLTVDPYTGSAAGTLRVVGLQDVDVIVRYPGAFSQDGAVTS